MITSNLFLVASGLFPLFSSPAMPVTSETTALLEPVAATTIEWTAPKAFVKGMPYEVTVTLSVDRGGSVPSSAFSPYFFLVNGKPLYTKDVEAGAPEPKVTQVPIAVGTRMELTFDLEPLIDVEADFFIDYLDIAKPADAMKVRAYSLLSGEVKFYEGAGAGEPGEVPSPAISDESLGGYHVLMETTQGQLLMQFWPDVAPKTVRNFLDLAHTGFYDGILFHRCVPGFVIQAGDPNTKGEATNPLLYGTGNGPRKVPAEFNDKKHTRGVLSMARLGGDENSATSQFFICHERIPGLDRKYTAFGVLLEGYNVVEDIIAQPMAINEDPESVDPRTGRPSRTPTDRPAFIQRIERAAVIVPLSK